MRYSAYTATRYKYAKLTFKNYCKTIENFALIFSIKVKCWSEAHSKLHSADCVKREVMVASVGTSEQESKSWR